VGSSPHAVLARLGRRSPLALALVYTATVLLPYALRPLAAGPALVPASLAAALLWIAVTLLLFAVVAWGRTDDALAAGVLLGVTIALGGLAARVLVEMVRARSVGPGLLLFMASLIPLFVRTVVLVALCTALVWAARRLTRLLGTVRRSTPTHRQPPTRRLPD